jgi:hypothetical protein
MILSKKKDNLLMSNNVLWVVVRVPFHNKSSDHIYYILLFPQVIYRGGSRGGRAPSLKLEKI